MKNFVKRPKPNEDEVQRMLADLKAGGHDIPEAEARRIALTGDTYTNDVYQVNIREVGTEYDRMLHLSIKRKDRECIHDWRDLQEIKNMLIGPECEGVELYPAESRRVDSANQYHLWCVPDPAFRYGFGFNERLVCDDAPESRTKQRSFA